MNKSKLIIGIILILIIGLAVGGYIWWNKEKKIRAEREALEKAEEAAKTVTESATKGTLPSLGTNPLENKPDINPADKANPFKNIKINPFE